MSVEEYTSFPKDDPIRVGIIIGSRSDLSQCVDGLAALYLAQRHGLVKVLPVIISSIHRHHKQTVRSIKRIISRVDCLIVGAGKAAHLPGMVDSIYRNETGDTRVPVIAVAFRGKTMKATRAAILSIEEVPGNQMIFQVGTRKNIGSYGFYRAALIVIRKIYRRYPIALKEIPKRERISLRRAIEIGEAQLATKK